MTASWDGIFPGGRLRRARTRAADAAAGFATLATSASATAGRQRAADARVLRVAPGRRGRAMLAVAVMVPAIACAIQPETEPLEARASAHRASPRSPALAALDRRVALLSAELQLTPVQQVQVRALLAHQREQVRQLWSEPDVAPAQRIGRMQAIGDRTADAIRGVLDEMQKKRYIQPRQREAAVGTRGADVEGWMAAEARK
jgi:hypothetical protein